MSLKDYLSDHLGKILLSVICATASALFLKVTGTQTGILLLLFPTLFLIFTISYLYDYYSQYKYLSELQTIFQGLDQKYLFAECVRRPKGCYEQKIFDLSRRAGRSMISTVSDAQAAQKEYREYVESWVHEIKAPITAATLMCRNIDSETRHKLTRELAQIEAHVERALFYARAESAEKDFIIRQCMLTELTAKAISQHRALLQQNNIRIETSGLDQTVFTDSKWMIFILGQLLQNAARYHGKDPVILLSANHLGKQVRLTVQDNGIGIPTHELPRVFDRGFTGSNGRIRGGSTGIGLYLCKKLAECLDIGLTATSEQDRGTTVTLIFPAKEI